MSDSLKLRNRLVVSYLTVRKIIGVLGVALPFVLIAGGFLLGNDEVESSLSLYYHTIMRDVFVGMLFAIGLGLLTYAGYDKHDNHVSNLACLLAMGVALFPTDPGDETTSIIGMLHLVFAGGFFFTLIYFAYFLFTKTAPNQQPTPQKVYRNRVYVTCAIIMLACILAIGGYYLLPEATAAQIKPYDPVFYLEAIAVVAFGVSWLTKGESIFKDVTVA